MSPHEAATRLVQALRQRRDGLRISLGLPPPSEPRLAASQPPGRFFFDLVDVPCIVAELQARLPAQADHIVAQADKICRRRFDLLGYQDLDFGEPIDWSFDPVHGKRAPLVPWSRVPFLDFGAVGDHKIVWELNRQQHLVTLAKAWWLRRDDRYLQELAAQWYHWRSANPYGVGINWSSSLEVAFRCLAWLWVLRLVPPSAPSRDFPIEFRDDLITELGRGARHIERYVSTYFAPNTHLLGEAVALFFVGALCPQFDSAKRWRDLGWRILIEQSRKQVRADGLHFEQSTYYHVYALDFFVHARRLAGLNDVAGASALDETIERMAEALRALAQAGEVPRFGDDDGGRLFDGRRNRSEHLADPLATCAVLFRRGDFKAACRELPEESLWLLGPGGVRDYDALAVERLPPRSTFLEASGIVCMGPSRMESSAGAYTRPSFHQLIIDAGPQGFGASGHGHADALSVQLIIDGHAALADPGTYCYPAEIPERDQFRGTSAHNTLEVDGVSQAEPAGSFAWRHQPQVQAERWVEGETGALFTGSHDGYARLSSPVTHRRWVASLGCGLYFIRDQALGEGTHDLRLFWHIGPEFAHADGSDPAATAVGDATDGPPRVQPGSLKYRGPQGIAFELIAAESDPWVCERQHGWWSAAYGQKSPALVVCRGGRMPLPAETATVVAVRVAREPASSPGGRLTKEAGAPADLSVYRYQEDQRSLLILSSDREGIWRWQDWTGDASFVVIEAAAGSNEIRRVFLAVGSRLEFATERLLDCRILVERWEWIKSADGEQVFCSNPGAIITAL